MSPLRSLGSKVLDGSPVALGAAVLVIAVGLMVLNFNGKIAGLFNAKDTRPISAVFTNTQQLRVGHDVRIDGVSVGKVAAVSRDAGGRTATVHMNFNKSAGPLYRDARAILRFKTVLGAAFYVRLERGTPGAGALGSAPIPVTQTSQQTEIDDITSIFRPNAVRGLQTMPGELARALSDRHAPARALGTLANVSPSVANGIGALRGQHVDRDLRDLVSSSAATTRALTTPDNELRTVVGGAAATVLTTAARQGDLRTTIARAPAVLQRTDATVASLDHTLSLADPLIGELRRPAGDVAPTVAHLRPTVVQADALLRRAVPLLDALRPAVTSLAGASRVALPLLNALTPSLDRLQHTILPYLAEVDPETQRTTSQMIGPTFTGLGSGAAGQQDVNGHFIRFPATSGSSPVYLPCQVYYGNPSSANAIACKSLQDSLSTYLNYNPLGGTPGSSRSANGATP